MMQQEAALWQQMVLLCSLLLKNFTLMKIPLFISAPIMKWVVANSIWIFFHDTLHSLMVSFKPNPIFHIRLAFDMLSQLARANMSVSMLVKNDRATFLHIVGHRFRALGWWYLFANYVGLYIVRFTIDLLWQFTHIHRLYKCACLDSAPSRTEVFFA